MPNVTCPECTLRVNPRNGACPSCGAAVKNFEENPPGIEEPWEWFSAKAIQRKQMWPAKILLLIASLCFLLMLSGAVIPGDAFASIIPLLAISFIFAFLSCISYLWYIRTTVSVLRDGEGNRYLHLRKSGGRTRKIPLPVGVIYSWWNQRHPLFLSGHLLRMRKPVLSLAIQDENGKTLFAFQEEAGRDFPVPPEWPEEERNYKARIIYDCFPFPRFNLPILKNTLEQIKTLQDRS